MKKQVRFSVLYAIMIMSLLASLAACGGGGGGGGGGPVSGATVLSGTVAAGAPIIGIVNVKGANGATASSMIAANGSFSLDVAALTANYILFAEGTVNGKTVKIYSVAVTPGTINITPITDLIVANALGAKPDDSLVASWTGNQVTAAELDAAKTTVQTAIAPLLTATGGSSVDPLTGSFNADGTGLDKSLDYLKVDYTGGTATITNLATGSTCTNNVATNSSTALPPSDATATSTAMTEEQAINVFFGKVATLYATSRPTYTQLETELGPYIASDVLDGGITYATYLSDLDQDGPPTGCTIKAVIERPMASSEYNTASYSKAYWTRVFFKCGTLAASFVDSSVFNGTTWLEYGNRRWIRNDIVALAYAGHQSTGTQLFTGFNLSLNDNYNYAYNQGVRSAVITGPGMPPAGVKYDLVFPNTYFMPVAQNYLFNASGLVLAPFQDSMIAAIPDNSVYTVKLFSVPTASFTGSEIPISTFTEIIPKRPYTNAELQAGASTIFPAFTAPTSYALADAHIGGSLPVSWTNPSTMFVDNAHLNFGDNSGNFQYYENSLTSGIVTATTLDTSSTTVTSPQWANLMIEGMDIFTRNIKSNWQFTSTNGNMPTFTVSGTVTNNNVDKTHSILIGVCADSKFETCLFGAAITPGNGGAYSVPVVGNNGQSYYVGACVDANNSGWCDVASDPSAVYVSNPVVYQGASISGVNITIP